MSLAGILAIQNRRNIRRETRVENFFGLRDACGNAGDDFRVCQLLEGFVFGHARILAHARVQVQTTATTTRCGWRGLELAPGIRVPGDR